MFRLTPSEYPVPERDRRGVRWSASTSSTPSSSRGSRGRATPVVARAYLDQLTRNKAVTPETATAIKAALDHRHKAKLKELAGQLDQAAGTAAARDAARLRSLSTTLKGLGA